MARSKTTSTNDSASNKTVEKKKVGRPKKEFTTNSIKIIDKPTDDNGFTVKRESMQSVSFA